MGELLACAGEVRGFVKQDRVAQILIGTGSERTKAPFGFGEESDGVVGWRLCGCGCGRSRGCRDFCGEQLGGWTWMAPG